MELKRDEIIKALEYCINRKDCSDCMIKSKELRSGCIGRPRAFFKNALALINSQEQRIKELTEKDEKLTKVITDLMREGETYLKQRDAFQNRVKYLEKENARLVEDNHILATEFKDNVKSDTLKKFAEVLCEGRVSNDLVVIAVKVAEKEMLEGTK